MNQRRPSQGFTEAQKAELILIVDEAIKRSVATAIRAELREAGLRVDGQTNQEASTSDFQFLRKFRVLFESGSSKIGGAILSALVLGIASLFVIGARAFFGK